MNVNDEVISSTVDADLQSKVENLDETALGKINPRIAEAIRAIQDERAGREPIAWADFSQHSKH
jgi:hypothetical protein